MILFPLLLSYLLEFGTQWSLVASNTTPFPIYPRPALLDEQLSASLQATVKFTDQQKVQTSFTLQPPRECSRDEAYNYTLLIWVEGITSLWHYEGPFKMSTCEGFVSIPVLGLNAGKYYTASVVVFNNKNSFKSKNIDIYTTAVQKVEVVKGDECLLVKCYFAPGSLAQGCVTEMKIVNSYTSQHIHILQQNITQDTDLMSGGIRVPLEPMTTAIDIQVYDWLQRGKIGSLSIPPLIEHMPHMTCFLGKSNTQFRARAQVFLFFISASFFLIVFLILLFGLMCKVGKLNRHFRNKSYEILEGRDSVPQRFKCADSMRLKRSSAAVASASKKPRHKSYGSYEIVEGPVAEALSAHGQKSSTENRPITATDNAVLCPTGNNRVMVLAPNGEDRPATPDNMYHSMAIVGEHVKES